MDELQPPYSLHSMSSVDSEHDDFEFTDDEDVMQASQQVFVLREKKGVIYPLDYKYRVDVGEFNCISFELVIVKCRLQTRGKML